VNLNFVGESFVVDDKNIVHISKITFYSDFMQGNTKIYDILYSFMLKTESTPGPQCDRKEYVNEKFQ